MDSHARDPWRTRKRPSVCAAGKFSRSMYATAGVRNIARSVRAGRPERRHDSAAGSAKQRTRSTSAGPSTSIGFGSSAPRILGIGARTGVGGALRYKTPLCRKWLADRNFKRPSGPRLPTQPARNQPFVASKLRSRVACLENLAASRLRRRAFGRCRATKPASRAARMAPTPAFAGA